MSKEKANRYVNEATSEYYQWLDSLIDQLEEGIFLHSLRNPKIIEQLKENMSKKDNLKVVKNLGKIPPEIYQDLERRHAGKLTKYGKIAYRGSYILEKVIEKLDEDDRIEELKEINNSKYPDRIQNYLLESRRTFWIGSYGSSIIMAGRATEFLIKNYLKNKGITYDEKLALARLINKLRGSLGSGKKKIEEELLEKIGEINRLYRNLTAHDNPTQFERKDAEFIWNNLKYVVDKLY